MTKKVTSLFRGRGVKEVDKLAEIIAKTFEEFGSPVEIVEAIDGYSSYHFHIRPLKAMRMKAFASFVEDLKYALSNDSVEIEAPIPNKKLVGITVQKKEELPPVLFSDALKWEEFKSTSPLTAPLGIDEFGNRHLIDIARTPHLLVAGTTGAGKSVLLTSIITSLIEKNSPEMLRFILIDPKRVELTLYRDLPHLLTPVITQAKTSVRALAWAVKEMERRYDVLEAELVANITSYHKNVYNPAKKKWEKGGSKEAERAALPESMPFIIIAIDELNDIMQAYPRELETTIVRLAQMSRAVGIHLIIATQRPSVNVITGSIKANVPSRIAMMVASQIDSRTIIDTTGAEKLRGSGDVLYLASDSPRPVRIQSLYISEDEIIEISKKLAGLYSDGLDTLDLDETNREGVDSVFSAMVGGDDDEDELYEEAKTAVIEAGKASTSYIQRKLRVGYSRAARLMDLLEAGNVIGPARGSEPRELKIEDV